MLLKPRVAGGGSPGKKRVEAESWEGVDRGLFEELRSLRRELAGDLPAYIVFGDASLRDMARSRPTTRDNFSLVHGVAQRKLEDYEEVFTALIRGYCEETVFEFVPEPQPEMQKAAGGSGGGIPPIKISIGEADGDEEENLRILRAEIDELTSAFAKEHQSAVLPSPVLDDMAARRPTTLEDFNRVMVLKPGKGTSLVRYSPA